MSVRRYIAGAALICLACAGCGRDVRAIKVTDANKDKLLESLKDERMPVGDVQLLIARQMRAAITGTSLAGKTLGELIDEERKFENDAKVKEAEEKRLADEAKAKQEAIAAELRKAITLTVFDKGFIPSNPYINRYEDYIELKCAYENTSGKDIRAFRGAVRFTDLFGAPIYTAGLTIDDPITAGQKGTWEGTIKFNQFVEEHVRFRNAALNDMKVTWVPNSIIFADGSQIGEKGQ